MRMPSPSLDGRKESRAPKACRQPFMALGGTGAPGRKKISSASCSCDTERTDLRASCFFRRMISTRFLSGSGAGPEMSSKPFSKPSRSFSSAPKSFL